MEKLAILEKSPLFVSLHPEELDMLAELSQERKFTAGEVVFNEGDVGDSLYVIVSGAVNILRKDKNGKQRSIAVLKEGEFFGEMSLIDKEYRSATCSAMTDVELLKLTNENLHSFARVYKNGFTLVVINIARVLSLRLRETSEKLAECIQ
ncbi:MAG: cyclic nucleotide-binding domain-containing protein [Deltaproteobacteria bacterium]|nr:cyclic nucleotide-binding domain-containing protein [Deltaproteobacteria bacterium]